MTCQLTLTGQLLVNPDACGGCSCGGGAGAGVAPVSMSAKALALGCSGGLYTSMSSTPCPAQISTPGLAGASYVDLPGADIPSISLLFVRTDLPVKLRLDGRVAALPASVAYPVTVAAPEVLSLVVDGGPPLNVALSAGSYSAAALVAAINAAAALAGWAYLPASVDAVTGRPVVRSSTTGTSSEVAVTVGDPAIGFDDGDQARGSGADVTVQGLLLAQFSPPIGRVEVSGNARVDVLAAG